MHSIGYRANTLLTFGMIVIAMLCTITSLTDTFHTPSPTAHVQVAEVKKFRKLRVGDDEIGMVLNISADLQSLFTWNTKQVFVFLAAEYKTPKNSVNQVSLWDAIIPEKEQAKFSILASNEYRFIDQGTNLRGKEYNMTLHWHIMPKTGKMHVGKLVMTGYRMPEQYR